MKKTIFLTLVIGFFINAFAVGQQPTASDKVLVVMDTSMGKITVELWPDKAPITVKNFLTYVDEKFYDGTLFHRVMPTFMIQGGGMLPGMKEKDTHAPIKNESTNGLSNERGTIAMAREDAADTASAQFFINVVDNPRLDRKEARDKIGYAVFGKVTQGMEVVDKIKEVKTGKKADGKNPAEIHENVPLTDVIITSVRRVEMKKD